MLFSFILQIVRSIMSGKCLGNVSVINRRYIHSIYKCAVFNRHTQDPINRGKINNNFWNMQEKREKSEKNARALAYIEKKVYLCTLFMRVWHES